MCIGYPLCIDKLSGMMAEASYGELREKIDISLLQDVAEGDYVLVFLKQARRILSRSEADLIHKALSGMSAFMQNGAEDALDNAFADLVKHKPELPPHLEEARRAGKGRCLMTQADELKLPMVVKLLEELKYPLLEGKEDFWPKDENCYLVFLPGFGRKNLETIDLAVIMPELLKNFSGTIIGAVASPETEMTINVNMGGIPLPAFVCVRQEKVLGALSRIRDWSDYNQRLTEMLAA